MTCCVGLVDKEGNLWMGADSQASRGWVKQEITDSKIIRKIVANGSDMLIGVAGSVRALNIIEYDFVAPEDNYVTDPDRYIVSTVIKSLRETLKDTGHLDTDNGMMTVPDTEFIIGYKEKLYQVGSNFGLTNPRSDYVATGSGIEVALGSLFTTGHPDVFSYPPELRIKLAIEAASNFMWGVGFRINIEKIEKFLTELP